MKPFRVVFLVLLPLVSACSDDEARVSVRYVPRTQFAALTPSIVVSAPGMRRTLSAAEVGFTGSGDPLTMATPTSGDLAVDFSLADRGTVASTGAVQVGLGPDWVWGFQISIDSVSPLRGCFGCSGARSFPLNAVYRRGPADSVWVSWGGNSIKHPVVY